MKKILIICLMLLPFSINAENWGDVWRATGNGQYEPVATSTLGITANAAWGNITGTLSNQTDLQNALDLKFNTSSFGTNFFTFFSATTTSVLTEGTNLYYTDARVNTYINASTTIPKTYSANTFTAAQIFDSITRSTTTAATTTNLFAGTASTTNFYGGGLISTCNGSGNKLTYGAVANGRFSCEADQAGGGGGGGNSKWATSTDNTSIYANTATKIGVGSTTPWGLFSLLGGSNGTPAFVVATTTQVNPLFLITSSSTGPYFASTTKQAWSVVNVGTTTQGLGGNLFNLYVNGRFNQRAQVFQEDFIGQIVQATADTNNIRPGLQFDIDGACTASQPAGDTSNGTVGVLRMLAGAASGNGCMLHMADSNNFATTSIPHMQVRIKWNSATTSQDVLIGFSNIAQNAVNATSSVTAGVYFKANPASSGFFQTVTRQSAVLAATTTTTSFPVTQRPVTLDIIYSTSTAMFLINGNVVAEHNSNIPRTGIEPTIRSERFTTVVSLDIDSLRVWADGN